jgi:uncharacterized protein YjbI with pentapeptide repeats
MTLRDWLGPVIVPLIAGLFVVGLTAWFNNELNERQQRLEDQRAEAEREVADQRAQDEALQAYLDQMNTLLLEKDLSDDKVKTLIHARTVTVLSRLDPGRKTQVMRFLDEVDLLQRRVDEGGSITREVYGVPISMARVDESSDAISLANADLSGADLIDVRLFRADLTNADLSDAKLHYASEASLVEANLTNADLTDFHPLHSHLRGADLTSANLTNANLIGADLSDAKLPGADLSDVDLTNALLTNADLSGADLTNADLTGSNVTPEQLAKVASLKGATLPNGQKFEDWLEDQENGKNG